MRIAWRWSCDPARTGPPKPTNASMTVHRGRGDERSVHHADRCASDLPFVIVSDAGYVFDEVAEQHEFERLGLQERVLDWLGSLVSPWSYGWRQVSRSRRRGRVHGAMDGFAVWSSWTG